MSDTHLQIVDGENENTTILSSEIFTSWGDAWNKYLAIIKREVPINGQKVRLANYRNGELKVIQETRL